MKDEYDFTGAKRGAVVALPSRQTEVRLRPDIEVLDWLRRCANESNGGSYQELINFALRSYMETQKGVALPASIDENGTAIQELAIAGSRDL